MRTCTVEGCKRLHEAKGFCNAHNKQRLKYGKIVNIKIKRIDPNRGCKVEGCKEKHSAKGYCVKHYNQMQRHGKILTRAQTDPNEIIINGDIAQICLYDVNGKELARATIDAEDVGRVEKHKWCLSDRYAQTWMGGVTVRMQHLVMEVEPNIKTHIDHMDGNGLNNRKLNLRFCTHAENLRNRKKSRINTSGYKGVFSAGRKWRAQIGVNRKRIWLGSFENKIDAALAYNKAAVRYHGEFAVLNII